MATLERARRLHSLDGWCFPAPTRASRQIHATTLAHVVRTIYGSRCTVHGFRSSFRDWASEQTSVPHAVAEAALAHQVGSDVERSYQPVAKVADPAWPRRDRARTLNGHGDGQETGGAPSVADVGGHGGPSDE